VKTLPGSERSTRMACREFDLRLLMASGGALDGDLCPEVIACGDHRAPRGETSDLDIPREPSLELVGVW